MASMTIKLSVYRGEQLITSKSRQVRTIPHLVNKSGVRAAGVVYRSRVYELKQVGSTERLAWGIENLNLPDHAIDLASRHYSTVDCPVMTAVEDIIAFTSLTSVTDWFLENTRNRSYVAMDGDEESIESVIDLFQDNGIEVITYGRSMRPAANGRTYDWYIRLGMSQTGIASEDDIRAALKSVPNSDSSPIRILRELEALGVTMSTNGTEVVFRGDIAKVDKGLVEAVHSSQPEIIEILKSRGQTEVGAVDFNVADYVNSIQSITITSAARSGLIKSGSESIPENFTPSAKQTTESSLADWSDWCDGLFSSIRLEFKGKQGVYRERIAKLDQNLVDIRERSQNIEDRISIETRMRSKPQSRSSSTLELQELRRENQELKDRVKGAEASVHQVEKAAMKTLEKDEVKELSNSSSALELQNLKIENQELKERIEIVVKGEKSNSSSTLELQELKTEKKELLDKVKQAEESAYDSMEVVEDVQAANRSLEQRIARVRSNETSNPSEMMEVAISTLLPRILLMYRSEEYLHNLLSPTPALEILKSINDNTFNAGNSVQNAKGWREQHFSTGSGDEGRVYYRPNGARVEVLLSSKATQNRDIRRLGRVPS
jgi:hypothetical protein